MLIGITSFIWTSFLKDRIAPSLELKELRSKAHEQNQKLNVLQKAAEDMKTQLVQANESLTNSTAVGKGLATGGDSRAEISFSKGDDPNSVSAMMMPKGGYPLRGLSIKITDETKHILTKRSGDTNALPEGSVVFQRSFGDVAVNSYADLCTLHFDPTVTNYYRFDVSALNGSYWQLISFSKTNSNWVMKLVYKRGQFGGRVEIDPPEMREKILVY
ncbi:MAG: hypothetical protein HZA89_05400 [Verrucomicrobia bacterium]|nr:hypothetical protein [Verrucomicrobiota bacterium]